VVSAIWYAGNANNLVDDLEIAVADSTPLQIRFPDKEWVHSRDLSRELLIDHGLVHAGDTSEVVHGRPHVPLCSMAAGRHRSLIFGIGPDRKVADVSLAAYGYTGGEVPRANDGQRTSPFRYPSRISRSDPAVPLGSTAIRLLPDLAVFSA
jgi:hypothetical protein